MMRNLVPVLLPRLEAHRLDGLNVGLEALYPFYDGFSLANIPSGICAWLGIPPFGSPPLGREVLDLYPRTFQHVILLVVDGMGLNTFEDALRQAGSDPDYDVWGEMAEQGALAPLTSIAPSTTSSALTTFWTGREPGEHGVVGYEMWLKEYGLIANMILHTPAAYLGDTGGLRRAGFDPLTFLPVPTIGRHLAQNGIRTYVFQHASIAGSGLSQMLQAEAEVMPFRSLSDLWVTLGAMLAESTVERRYTYIYWGDLDEHSHRFGPADPRVALEFAGFSRQLGRFLRQRKHFRGKTLLLITADHGHIFTPRRPEYEMRNHPRLVDMMAMLPSGEARMPFVFLRPGRQDHFLRYLETTWPGEFLAVPAEQAIHAGLFGSQSVCQRLPDRVGDFVVFPQGNAYWWFGSRNNLLLGRHGGLSRTEMLVPLFSLVL